MPSLGENYDRCICALNIFLITHCIEVSEESWDNVRLIWPQDLAVEVVGRRMLEGETEKVTLVFLSPSYKKARTHTVNMYPPDPQLLFGLRELIDQYLPPE